jgi:hypothetical protein
VFWAAAKAAEFFICVIGNSYARMWDVAFGEVKAGQSAIVVSLLSIAFTFTTVLAVAHIFFPICA